MEKDKVAFQCKKCGYRTALRSGTALEKSHLPYLYWFKAILMLSASRKTFSANEIQNQLRHELYEPIWSMLHKIKIVMGKRDSRYELTEFIEIDEGFFETISTAINTIDDILVKEYSTDFLLHALKTVNFNHWVQSPTIIIK